MKDSMEHVSNEATCDKAAIIRATRLLGDMWALLIIRELLNGKKRFGEIQEGLGKVNPQTLSGRLKQLEQCGFLTRQAYAEIPPRVEYALTEKGLAVRQILEALADYGTRFLPEHGNCASGYNGGEVVASGLPESGKDIC